MSWRVWATIGFISVSTVSGTINYYEISVPSAVETTAGILGIVMGPGFGPIGLGVIALAFAINRRWLLLAPLPTIPISPILQNAGYYPRYPDDTFSITTPDGFAVYAVLNMIIWGINVLLGLRLRAWWERRRAKTRSTGPVRRNQSPPR